VSSTGGVVIAAHELGLKAPRGWVYRDVDLSAKAGSLVLVQGCEGSGKTMLLLTLASRARYTEGSLLVGGVDAARRRHATRALVGLGEFPTVNDLDATLTVHQQVMAELALHGLPWRRADVRHVLSPLGHDIDPDLKVGDLSSPDRLLLGTALALVGEPPVIALDRADRDLAPDERHYVIERLRKLTDAGVCVIAGAVDPSLGCAADVTLALPSADAVSADVTYEGGTHALA
jgi:ABC-2 type transport system ATP-binding protein